MEAIGTETHVLKTTVSSCDWPFWPSPCAFLPWALSNKPQFSFADSCDYVKKHMACGRRFGPMAIDYTRSALNGRGIDVADAATR
jgi:hypothetical protein